MPSRRSSPFIYTTFFYFTEHSATLDSHTTPTLALTIFEKEGYVRHKNNLRQHVFMSHISLLTISSISA